jgi:hypothetical protein
MRQTFAIDSYLLDPLMRDLVGHDRRPSAFLVYLWLSASTPHGCVALSYAQLAERTGLSKRAVQDAVKHLASRGLLEVTRRGQTDTPAYRALRPWTR